MTKKEISNIKEEWARLRFSIVGPLLTCPPDNITKAIKELVSKTWTHPTQNRTLTFSYSTIERWYYQALRASNPIEVLGRRIRSDAGGHRSMPAALSVELLQQYRSYPNWTYLLHYDNLIIYAKTVPTCRMPSYPTLRRYMQDQGWFKCRKTPKTKGELVARDRLENLEVRSYEVGYVHALWHSDFHHGSLRVVDINGNWHTPVCFCILDDCSRLCCHIQWYLPETAETFVHGLIQAFQKRGLPRSLMTDNGSPMIAEETTRGLMDLSIVHATTLPYSPYQNGKQEFFWSRVEGRLVSMLQQIPQLTLKDLNIATLAWVEHEYHKTIHSELKITPLDAMLTGHRVERPCPETEALRFAFTSKRRRIQRRSDGTISLDGVRFEVPSRLRHLKRVWVRLRRWDMSSAIIVDELDHQITLAKIFPVDRTKNSDSKRRSLEPSDIKPQEALRDPYPPLLKDILSQFSATGLPPAYIPHGEVEHV
jgi:putative transposase